jgi:hypothetical protein
VIAPRHLVHCGDREFPVTQRGEAWVITIAGAEYFLTAAVTYGRSLNLFCRERLRGLGDDELRHPSLIASPRFPILITVDRVLVRAWPALVERGTGSKTYANQATGDRELATRGPVWMFSAPKRPSTEGGTTNYQQTIDDVADMAKLWLRGAE